MATVHIIGGGVSGLAAATLLAEAHIPVKLYEATAHAGGRARSSTDAVLGTIDHGLHLIGGESRELFAYLARIGAADTLSRVQTPWQFHRAPLLDYLETASALATHDTAMETQLAPENILAETWLPSLARTVLHTPLDQLSNIAIRRALWRKLRRGKKGGQFFVPTHSLDASFVAPALAHLEYHGGSIYFGHALKALEWANGCVTSLTFARKKVPLMEGDVLILATPASFTQPMLPSITAPTSTHASITLHYACHHREAFGHVAAPLAAPVDVVRYTPNRISVMLRLADAQWHSDPELLVHRLWRWLQTRHPYLETQAKPPHALWREKRAGHLLTPHPRTDISRLPPRLLLAGDWLDAYAPASLELAAANGHAAARAAAALIPKAAPRHQTSYAPFGR